MGILVLHREQRLVGGVGLARPRLRPRRPAGGIVRVEYSGREEERPGAFAGVRFTPMRALELKIPPPIVVVLVGTAMWFASPHPVPPEFPFYLRLGAFILIALIGGGIALAGDLEFKRAGTTISPLRPGNATALVTTGI